MTTVVSLAASDASALVNLPTRNYGGRNPSSIGSGSSGRLYYVYFNRSFPLGATIMSAKLRVYQQGAATGGSRTLFARRLGAAWQESTITYANAPAITGVETEVTQGNSSVDGRAWEIDVAPQMQEVSDGAPWFGLRLRSSITELLYIYARENPDMQPTLEVEWSDAPDQPTVLSPSNGRAVSIARPTLSFDYSDVTDDAMTGYQVQLNATDSWTAPTHDTGTVDASVPLHMLTFDVSTGATWFWRVRVRDASNLWSAWSDAASFTRAARPTVTITNPAASPASVYDPRPVFSWSVSGGTQTAFQVFVTDPDDVTEVLWDSGRTSSAITSAQLGADTVLSPGESYRMVLRVWDATAREGTPGDPAYTEVTRTFTFGLSASVPGVSSFSATAGVDTPEVLLSWQRPAAPDSFTVVRDGVTIASGLDPAQLLSAGTSYAWTDTTAAPRTPHTYLVLAVDGGLSSESNSMDTAQTAPEGVWLSSIDGSHRVNLASEDGEAPSTEASELSEVHRPLGAKNPVLITQAVFGREGRYAGYLQKWAGSSYANELEAWKALTDTKRYPRGVEMVLTMSDTAMRVFIYEVVTGFRSEFHDDKFVSFSYCELL